MKKTVISAAVCALLVAGSAQAEFKFDQSKLYAGGGLGWNGFDEGELGGFGTSVDIDRAIGFQFFAGYDLDIEMTPGLKTLVEAGYMTSGNGDVNVSGTKVGETTDISGLWVTAVVEYPVADKVSVLGRLGLDLGDDDGLMYGVGAGYEVNSQIDVRGEYVLRDFTDSLQVNVVYNF